MNILDDIGREQVRKDIPEFKVGDTVRVHFRIVEGEKERTQVFEGVVISRKGGIGPLARFTVRRVAYSEGVERVFPLHSPRVEKVEVTRQGRVRRAKLHYLRDRSGKAARVRAADPAGRSKGKAAVASVAAPAPAPDAAVEAAVEAAEPVETPAVVDTPVENETPEEKAND